MNIQGKIVELFDTNNVSAKFRKRELVIEYADNPQYPQHIILQLTQDRCDIIEKYGIQTGQVVDIDFNLRGRKWVSPDGVPRWFNTLEAWKIQVVTQSGPMDEKGEAINLENNDPNKVVIPPNAAELLHGKPKAKNEEEIISDDLPF